MQPGREFYSRNDVVSVARDLLGMMLYAEIDGHLTSGIIVETEAYRGPEDRGSHAYKMRRTPRTEPMYWRGGTAYVYICYGIHHLFNIVTGDEGMPHAVLIRGIEPIDGQEVMLRRRGLDKLHSRLTAGPGALSAAMGITSDYTGIDLLKKDSPILIKDTGLRIPEKDVVRGPRVGMNFEGKYKTIPWRFSVNGNKWVSPAK